MGEILMKFIVTSIFIFCVPIAAFAGSSYTGKIKQVVCHVAETSPVCQVMPSGSVLNETCGTSGWKYTFDGTTAEGKNILSILLAAQVSQKTIVLRGLGKCTFGSTTEDLRHAYITE